MSPLEIQILGARPLTMLKNNNDQEIQCIASTRRGKAAFSHLSSSKVQLVLVELPHYCMRRYVSSSVVSYLILRSENHFVYSIVSSACLSSLLLQMYLYSIGFLKWTCLSTKNIRQRFDLKTCRGQSLCIPPSHFQIVYFIHS